MQDRLTADEMILLRDAAEAQFADLARQHDALNKIALAHFKNNQSQANASEIVQAMHHSRMADAVKAIMKVRFPEASEAWFNE